MFTILSYTKTNAGAMTNDDMTFVTDPEFTGRNSHVTFTEDYDLVYDWITGTAITSARYQVPTWNAIGIEQLPIVNINASAVPNSPPQLGNYYARPLPIPKNEEFQVQSTGSGADTTSYIMVIRPRAAGITPPPGGQPYNVKATATVTATSYTWSAAAALTFSQSLRGGVYAVIGCTGQVATRGQAFRLIFPKNKIVNGRRLRPGWLVNAAVGDQDAIPVQVNPLHMGVWGYFHTFEPPLVELYGNSAGSVTLTLMLRLIYMGDMDSSGITSLP